MGKVKNGKRGSQTLVEFGCKKKLKDDGGCKGNRREKGIRGVWLILSKRNRLKTTGKSKGGRKAR